MLTSHDINYTGEATVCVYEVVLNHLAAYTYGTVHTMLFYYKTFKDGQTVSGLTNLVVLFLNSGFGMDERYSSSLKNTMGRTRTNTARSKKERHA